MGVTGAQALLGHEHREAPLHMCEAELQGKRVPKLELGNQAKTAKNKKLSNINIRDGSGRIREKKEVNR
ncbi:MAG: hypothetical protein D3925_10635 [Candidatus Electrothrix sp. AR5]|nr:hypothetical protein [Candidatus Electrothrix sp. AR5]